MKILHLTFSLNNAGKENTLVDIANEQESIGNEVAILVINNLLDQDIVDRISSNIHLYRLNRKSRSRNLVFIFRLFQIFNSGFKPDVIHSHDPQLGLLLKLTTVVPAFLTIHGPDFATGQMKYYKRLFAVSTSVKTDVESRSKNKCDVIFNGIRINSIIHDISKKNHDEYNVITVGRLDHLVKGQDLLIDAANILINKKGLKMIKFFLVGEGLSHHYLEKLILIYNLNENVFLLGNRNREWIYENLYKYDLFVQPSRLEGFGLSVIEAMAAGVPVLASDIEGPAEILDNGKYGIMFRNNSFEDLATKIEYTILLKDSSEIIKLTESAFQHCINNFDISRTARAYCEHYDIFHKSIY